MSFPAEEDELMLKFGYKMVEAIAESDHLSVLPEIMTRDEYLEYRNALIVLERLSKDGHIGTTEDNKRLLLPPEVVLERVEGLADRVLDRLVDADLDGTVIYEQAHYRLVERPTDLYIEAKRKCD